MTIAEVKVERTPIEEIKHLADRLESKLIEFLSKDENHATLGIWYNEGDDVILLHELTGEFKLQLYKREEL